MGKAPFIGYEGFEIPPGEPAGNRKEPSFLQLPVLVPDDQVSFCLTDGTGRGDLISADI